MSDLSIPRLTLRNVVPKLCGAVVCRTHQGILAQFTCHVRDEIVRPKIYSHDFLVRQLTWTAMLPHDYEIMTLQQAESIMRFFQTSDGHRLLSRYIGVIDSSTIELVFFETAIHRKFTRKAYPPKAVKK